MFHCRFLQFRFVSFLVCALAFSVSVRSQSLINRTQLTVYTFEEFAALFNGENEEVSVLAKFPKLKGTDRFQFIQHLFNPKADSTDHSAIAEFASYVTRWDKKVTWDNTLAYAGLVYTDAKKHEIPVLAGLRVLQSDSGPYWALQSVSGSIFQAGDSAKVGYIGIASNEVGFQEFGQITGANPQQICGEGFRVDNRSIFLYLTSNGLLKYNHTDNIYYLVDLDDYVMTVGHVIDENQALGGWVILSLSKNQQKIF